MTNTMIDRSVGGLVSLAPEDHVDPKLRFISSMASSTTTTIDGGLLSDSSDHPIHNGGVRTNADSILCSNIHRHSLPRSFVPRVGGVAGIDSAFPMKRGASCRSATFDKRISHASMSRQNSVPEMGKIGDLSRGFDGISLGNDVER